MTVAEVVETGTAVVLVEVSEVIEVIVIQTAAPSMAAI
jgi:hypothetical protein